MQSWIKLSVLVIGIAIVTGCSNTSASNNSQAAAGNGMASSAPATTTAATTVSKADSEKKTDGGHDHRKGDGHNHKDGDGHSHTEPVKVGDYSMELESHKEGNELHFDFHLHKGKDEVTDARVTAQFQMPDGSQKSLEMPFSPEEKAYVAKLSSPAAGEYKVAVLSDLKGEKMNARFTIKQ
jgi:hypothetical protein